MNLAKLIRTASVLSVGLLSGSALAQGTPDQPTTDPTSPTEATPTPTPPPPPVTVTDPATTTTVTTEQTTVYTPAVMPEPVASEEPFLERYGIGVVLGGGVEGFTDQTMRDTTNVGGNWDVRAIFGTRQYLGFEAAYIGSAQGINALGLDTNAVLVGNGVQGNLRLNFTKDNLVQPFAYAGAAWRRYDLQNADFNTSAVNESDDVLEIPMGVGLGYKYRGLLFEARGEFRATTNEDLMPSLAGNDDFAKMHRWGANANLGYAF